MTNEAENARINRGALGLPDQPIIELDARRLEAFLAVLDAPPADNLGLHELLARIPAWEDHNGR